MPFHRRFADRAGSAPATALNLTREKGYLSASFVLALSCCTSQGRTPRIIACHLSGRPRWLPVQCRSFPVVRLLFGIYPIFYSYLNLF